MTPLQEAKLVERELDAAIKKTSREAVKLARRRRVSVVFLEGDHIMRLEPSGRTVKLKRVRIKQRSVKGLPTRL